MLDLGIRSFSAMPQALRAILLLWLVAALLAAREVAVQILHTTDLHGELDAAAPASMQRIGARIWELRREFGESRCLHIDTGDTIQGSLAATISRGEAPLQMLRAIRCDAWIPGNHEFDFGSARFAELAETMRPWIICGNLHPKRPGTPPYPAWKIFEIDGARIAVIGATASYLRQWFAADLDQLFRVELVEPQLKRILPEVRAARPDAIVLALHQGWTIPQQDPRHVNEVADLADRHPELDLILGGHTHRNFPGRRIGERSWYVQPGAHAEYLARVTLFIDTEKHCVDRIESRLVHPAETIPPALAEAASGWLAQTRLAAAEVVAPPPAHAITPAGRPGINCQVSELLAAALAEAADAPLALHGILSQAALAPDRPITGADLFALIPYENTLVTCEVTADELAAIIAEQWSIRANYTYSGIHGAFATLNPDGSAIVTAIGPDRAPPVPGKRYRLALNSFTAAGSGRLPVLRSILRQPDARRKDTRLSTRTALHQYLARHPRLAITPTRWLTK